MDAIVRAKLEGSWQPLAPVWGLSVEADEHGPASATFVTKRSLPKFTEVEVLVGGLVVADGWIESSETMDDSEGLHTLTVWCWQRHLDDDVLWRTWMMSGFDAAIDAREDPIVNQSYWARSGIRLDNRSLTIGMQPNTIWYAQQAGGVTFDLGPMSNVGARSIWINEVSRNMPATGMQLYVRAHSLRGNHHPVTPGEYVDAVVASATGNVAGGWQGGAVAANTFRYVSIYAYATITHDLLRDAPEYHLTFSEVRINTIGAGGGTATSQNGSGITADQAVPSIIAPAGLITLRRNVVSTTDIYGLATHSHQTPRQMLERVNLDQWRYRVNPGRFLDREPYPTLPTLTATRDARARLRTPETYSFVVVPYRDAQGDEQWVRRTNNPDRPRTHVIQLDSNATAAQADAVATAFLKDQLERRVEGTVTIAPGQLLERPSGQPVDPAQLLLAGGDRIWVNEAEDHARISRVTYDHDARTATVDLTEPSDDLDRELAYLSEQPT